MIGHLLILDDLACVGCDWTFLGIGDFDFDGDGKVDVLWRNNNGNLSLWIPNPPGSVLPYSHQDFGNVPLDWHIEPMGTP